MRDLAAATRDEVLAEFDRTYEEVQVMLAERMTEAGLEGVEEKGPDDPAALRDDMRRLVEDLHTLRTLCDRLSRRVTELAARCERADGNGSGTS